MKKLGIGLILFFVFLGSTLPAFAATSAPDISSYTDSTLQIITAIATTAVVLFLVRGGYQYITSTGSPDALENAKRTIRNALIGLVIVLAARVIMSGFQHALSPASNDSGSSAVNLTPITTTTPKEGLTQVLIDAVSAFMQNIVESSTKPIVDGIMGYLTTTPSVLSNSVVLKFWLVSLGIVDALFVVVVALLGLHVMSATSFGFEEIELKHLIPRIGLAFLGANMSLFLADYSIVTCNALVNAVLNSTDGLHQAWIQDAINPATLITGTTPLITLIFLIIFLIVAIVLLLMYISRLILISLGAVLSPFVFLLWLTPKGADIAEMSVKTYLVSVFMIFVHVVVIQLAGSFLTLPGTANNSLVSIAVAIGLLFTLLKVPSLMMQMVTYTSNNGALRKMGNQMMNIISTDQSYTDKGMSSTMRTPPKAAGKVVHV